MRAPSEEFKLVANVFGHLLTSKVEKHDQEYEKVSKDIASTKKRMEKNRESFDLIKK